MKRLFALLAMVGVLAGCAPAGAQPTSTTATGSAITAELAKVKVVASRPQVPGYKRAEFGKAWADTDHNGCDTRNDLLKAQLTAVKLRDGSNCVVVAGQLADPYTGRTIRFVKAEASKVQIDHVYPLARAWDMGASSWPLEKRVEFANDESANLLAVDGKANESKGDSGPGEWLPLNKAYRCTYVLLYLQVAEKYGLPATKADADTARTIAPTCGGAR